MYGSREGLCDACAQPRLVGADKGGVEWFVRGCVACDEPVESGDGLWCGACGLLVDRVVVHDVSPSVFAYGGPVAEALRRFKFRGRLDVGYRLARAMTETALCLSDGVDCVVPVPLHWTRLCTRRFNTAAVLARAVARALHVPVRHGLRRRRYTRPQSTLDRAHRSDNVRDAFSAVPRMVEGRRVLLVDDVRTTGNTLAAASDALCNAGASGVQSLTLACYQP